MSSKRHTILVPVGLLAINCWKQVAQVPFSTLSKFASQCHMAIDEYKAVLIQAFTEGQNHDFEFDFKQNTHELILKKDIGNQDIKMKFGRFQLEKQLSCAVIQDFLLDTLAHNQAESKKQICELKEAEKQLKLENERLVKLLEETLNIKEKMESELYAKFIAILNEKKKKIRELSKGVPPKQAANKEAPSSSRQIEKDEDADEYDEETDYETDEESAVGKKRKYE
ncbi:DNA repair protein XRCC4-like isoform X2 [Artemia franciscana]|uniref:DNA repair protein XRCC4-like isoform X2 n=1 Tax=Artemia franciscana TaxID=6661 RepID=UPI0032D9C8F5